VAKSISPKALGELGVDKSTADKVVDCAIGTFSHAIRLWRVWRAGLMFNARVQEVIEKLRREVLAAIVRAKRHN
jgi:hypothetical protein